MNIYLLRHGACEDLKPGGDDASRLLTPEGRKTIEASLPGMRKLIGQVEFILTSPIPRAAETARIVGVYFKCDSFIETVPALAEQGSEKKVLSIINKLIGKDNLVIVGHMPSLSELAALITGTGPEGTMIDLKKGGMAKIYIKGFAEPGGGVLRWVMSPAELARAADA